MNDLFWWEWALRGIPSYLQCAQIPNAKCSFPCNPVIPVLAINSLRSHICMSSTIKKKNWNKKVQGAGDQSSKYHSCVNTRNTVQPQLLVRGPELSQAKLFIAFSKSPLPHPLPFSPVVSLAGLYPKLKPWELPFPPFFLTTFWKFVFPLPKLICWNHISHGWWY